LLALAVSARPASAQDPIEVKFAWVEGWEAVNKYRIAALKLALSNQARPYTVVPSEPLPTQKRAVKTVINSATPMVIAMGTSQEMERTLLPVHAPIYLGIGSGYRLMLIRKSLQSRLSTVRTLGDLKNFSIGQGSGWTDVSILRNAGLNVEEVAKEEFLIRMTERGRFDLYSRGLFEIFSEYHQNKARHPGLAIDEHILLVYPFAILFFTGPSQMDLRDAIMDGMRKAYATGQLQDLLVGHETTRDTLASANLANRTRIDIPPYGLGDKTVTALKAFRFVPGKPIGTAP